MADIKVHVGDTVEDMGRRFGDAWRRAERGEAVNERHLSFDSFDTLARTLTPPHNGKVICTDPAPAPSGASPRMTSPDC
jgi:predicted transcriptional regulator